MRKGRLVPKMSKSMQSSSLDDIKRYVKPLDEYQTGGRTKYISDPEEVYYGKTLPEVTVTDKLDRTNPTALQNWSKKNDPITYAVREATGNVAEALRTPLEFAPGTGDVMDAAMLLEAVDKGDYGTLGTAALATALPGVTAGGLKRVSKYLPEIDLGRWGKFNESIPDNKILRDEYADIEQMTKANNTWMKNPDGSAFRGTPEQFVQQQSENFKRAFPPEHFERMLHGSKSGDLQTLDVSKNRYGQQAYGEGLYLTDSPNEAKWYAGLSDDIRPEYRSPDGKVYELGVNTEGAQKFSLDSYEDKNFLNKWNRSYIPTIEQYFRQPLSEISPEDIKRYESFQPFAEHIPDNMKDLSKNIILESGYQNDRGATKWILGKSGIKSLEGNSGMFDMTNPNIYKKYGGKIPEYQDGGRFQIPAELMQQHRNEVKLVESADGTLMKNPESSATGFYGQLFSEVKDLPEMRGISRNQFAADTALQNQIYNRRFEEGLPGIPSTSRNLEDLYEQYGPQIQEKGYGPMDVAGMVNLLGRQGTREYLGYHVRDKRPLSDVFPSKYGAGKRQANKTPDEYIEEMRSIRPGYIRYNYDTNRYRTTVPGAGGSW